MSIQRLQTVPSDLPNYLQKPSNCPNVIRLRTREDQGVREVIPHIGPIPITIPLKLFLEGVDFLTDYVTSRVAWKLRGGGKVQKHVGVSW